MNALANMGLLIFTSHSPLGLRFCGGANGTDTFAREPGRTAGPSAAPDFLSKTVASVDFMRLSLRKAAYVPLVEPRSRKSGYARDDKWRLVTLIKGG
jgi:hypothetical protein